MSNFNILKIDWPLWSSMTKQLRLICTLMVHYKVCLSVYKCKYSFRLLLKWMLFWILRSKFFNKKCMQLIKKTNIIWTGNDSFLSISCVICCEMCFMIKHWKIEEKRHWKEEKSFKKCFKIDVHWGEHQGHFFISFWPSLFICACL